jgi:1-acyl-sn-glycerol-3-phosphate acyltransferase
MQKLSKFIFTRILGWKLVGDFPKHLKKYVVIAAPHTSWKDFPIAILARNSSGEKVNFIGKNSLFKGPFGFIFRSLGGTPVDRSQSSNMVDAIVQIFENKKEFRLGISPEGTRKKVAAWKTGFYYIAKGANVPIVMATLDFENNQIKFSEPYDTTNDKEKDFKHFHAFFKGVKGKHSELS